MDQKQILSIMYDAFKSLTPSNVEILELEGPEITVLVVAEKYSSISMTDRVELLTKLLRAGSLQLSLNYITTFIPLIPTEVDEWSQEYQKESKHSFSFDNKKVAKSVEI